MNKSEIEDITNQSDISVEIKNFNNFYAKIEDVKSQIGKQVFGQENTIDLCPVSYTHLDVYKRQVKLQLGFGLDLVKYQFVFDLPIGF